MAVDHKTGKAPHSFLLTNKSEYALPRVPFRDIKETVLGKSYVLSVAFVRNRDAKLLNQRFRRKDTVPNVLAFAFSSTEGEIVIAHQKARAEAPRFRETPRVHTVFLFIHGLLHLKGLRHGSRMNTLERKFLKRFAVR